MLETFRWWPMVVGNAREQDDRAPSALLVSGIRVFYQQFERDQCLMMGVASCLHYCGLKSEAVVIALRARRYEEIALIEMRKDMKRLVPCIGECVTFNSATSKKKTIKRKLSIPDLIKKRTRFPTVVIPFERDGSNNHSFVVVDNLIFDSTQPCVMKLCLESLDWICGKYGIGSIDVAFRFNAGHGTKEKLSRKDTTNW
jgi:hypothetical protein